MKFRDYLKKVELNEKKYKVGDKVTVQWHGRFKDAVVTSEKGVLNNTIEVKFTDDNDEVETHTSNVKLKK